MRNQECHGKNISDGKEMIDNINGTKSEIEFASVEDSLNMHRTASNEAALVSDIPNIINDKIANTASGQGKTPASILRDEICEEHFLIFFIRANLL